MEQMEFRWNQGPDAEIAENERKIAELKARLQQLEGQGSMRGMNELDTSLAANRAEVGDFGTAGIHLGRIDNRLAADRMRTLSERQYNMNRLTDAQYKYMQLENEVNRLRLEEALVPPENAAASAELLRQREAAELARDLFYDQNKTLLGYAGVTQGGQQKKAGGAGGEKTTIKRTGTPQAANATTIAQVRTNIENCIEKGTDGNEYLKENCAEEVSNILNDIASLERNGERAPELTQLKNKLTSLKTIPDAVKGDTLENLKVWVAKPENYSKYGFYNEEAQREEFRKKWNALSEEQKNTEEAQKLKKTYWDKWTVADYRNWRKKMRAEGDRLYGKLTPSQKLTADNTGNFKDASGNTWKRNVVAGKTYWENKGYKG